MDLKIDTHGETLYDTIRIEPAFAAPMPASEGFELRAVAVSIDEHSYSMTLDDGLPPDLRR